MATSYREMEINAAIAIGRLIMAWAPLENALSTGVATIAMRRGSAARAAGDAAGDLEAYTALRNHDPTSFRKAAAWRTATLSATKDAKTIKKIEQIVGKFGKLKDVRDDLAHGFMAARFNSNNQEAEIICAAYERLHKDNNRKFPKPVTYKLQYVHRVISEISDLVLDISSVHMAITNELLSLAG